LAETPGRLNQAIQNDCNRNPKKIEPGNPGRLNKETQEDCSRTPRRLYQKPLKIQLRIPRRLNQKPQED